MLETTYLHNDAVIQPIFLTNELNTMINDCTIQSPKYNELR